MRRGERVNASAEPSVRELGRILGDGLRGRIREEAGEGFSSGRASDSPGAGQGFAPGGAYLDSRSKPTGGFRVTPSTSPKPIGERDEAEQKSPSEIFAATIRRPANPSGAASPRIQTRLKVDTADQGPCLYFGPSGERCDRRALRDGYCAAHLPAQPSQQAASAASTGPTAEKPYQRTVKVVSVLAALVGFLAPLLENIIREILRWLHSH
jgi:hypothetical protein